MEGSILEAGAFMPIFEFECQDCGNQFEKFTRPKERKKIRCPACSSRSVKKLLSSFSCLGMQLTKRLKFDAEEGLKREKLP
jgi:putative FmdB family regulatory protein